jgi:DDE superfamily endonuclease
LQTKRWLPHRRVVVVADSGFSALELIAAVRRHVCLITRLRLDASLFDPAPKRPNAQTPKRPNAQTPKRPNAQTPKGSNRTACFEGQAPTQT